jgi:hypothetical protein
MAVKGGGVSDEPGSSGGRAAEIAAGRDLCASETSAARDPFASETTAGREPCAAETAAGRDPCAAEARSNPALVIWAAACSPA